MGCGQRQFGKNLNIAARLHGRHFKIIHGETQGTLTTMEAVELMKQRVPMYETTSTWKMLQNRIRRGLPDVVESGKKVVADASR